MNKRTASVICALIIGLGIFGAGYTIGKSFYLAKKLNRIVTVKGLAEQDVKSDLGLWEINYREIGNDLIKLNTKLQQDEVVVTTFLKQQGFVDQELDRTQYRIEDRLANVYGQTPSQSATDQRYVVTAGIRVRSGKVDIIQKSTQLVDQILQQGVALTFESMNVSPNPSFYYTKLDAIRPAMLAAATKSARIVATQFAKDSGSRLGGIQRASQGLFQIMGRDTSTMSADWNTNQNALGSIDKKVRLVTTIDYQLR